MIGDEITIRYNPQNSFKEPEFNALVKMSNGNFVSYARDHCALDIPFEYYKYSNHIYIYFDFNLIADQLIANYTQFGSTSYANTNIGKIHFEFIDGNWADVMDIIKKRAMTPTLVYYNQSYPQKPKTVYVPRLKFLENMNMNNVLSSF
jgi:hypothetical protein